MARRSRPLPDYECEPPSFGELVLAVGLLALGGFVAYLAAVNGF